ncbi:MAG: App1 family protein [Opitutales bacterium]
MSKTAASSSPRPAWRRALRRLRFLLWRSLHREQGQASLVLEPYRGCGTPQRVYLMGRVYRQALAGAAWNRGLARDLMDLLRLIFRWGVGGVAVEGRLGGSLATDTTDQDGYFRLEFAPEAMPPLEGGWEDVPLVLREHPDRAVEAVGRVYLAPASTEYVVLSDIDDTVVYTGVAQRVRMLWRLFMAPAESRVAFDGVAALYKGLHAGRTGEAQNPMVYVSRGPWSTYPVISEFFQRHEIPIGPVLFLREWGLTVQSPLPRRATEHKAELVERMFTLYPDQSFVLLGDSGQHDAQLYADAVRRHPGRVLAVYIRKVAHAASREKGIDALREAAEAEGIGFVLADDSEAIARHAVEAGLIEPAWINAVRGEKAAEGTPSKQGVEESSRS